MNDKSWLDGELFVRDLDATWSSVSAGCFHQEFYFCPWQNGTLSAFFGPSFSFSSLKEKRLSFAFDFSMSKDFSKRKELPRVNIVNCAIEKHAPRCAKTPPGSSPRCEMMTRSWVISFYIKIRFSKELGCFWRFDIFFFWNRYVKCSNSV